MQYLLTLAALVTAPPQEALQAPAAGHLPQDMLAGRVSALEERVANLEKKAGIAPPAAPAAPTTGQTFNAANYTYDPTRGVYWPVGSGNYAGQPAQLPWYGYGVGSGEGGRFADNPVMRAGIFRRATGGGLFRRGGGGSCGAGGCG